MRGTGFGFIPDSFVVVVVVVICVTIAGGRVGCFGTSPSSWDGLDNLASLVPVASVAGRFVLVAVVVLAFILLQFFVFLCLFCSFFL